MKAKIREADNDLRPEYDFDFSQGERGRYFKRLVTEGANVVILDPDIAQAFPDSAAVNSALRSLLEIAGAAVERSRATARKVRRRLGVQ